MADRKSKELIYDIIRSYVERMREKKVDIWRLYLYGSYAKGTYHEDSDIDLAVFLNQDDIDGLEEDLMLMRLRWDIDLRIEPHSFACRIRFRHSGPDPESIHFCPPLRDAPCALRYAVFCSPCAMPYALCVPVESGEKQSVQTP